jgi:4-aminobutyrate aminotransferase-like enzyme
MTIARTAIWLHRPDLADLDPQHFSRLRGCGLGLVIALSAPHQQRAADPKKRRGVLNNNLERSQSPGRNEVH